ncbi:hypothetical protein LTR33_012307, partial [Friedmanniomyces endolithicus]
MAEYDLLIINGLVVSAEDVREVDIAIKGDKIAAVTARGRLDNTSAARTIDAEGAYVTPGGVDAHVHLQEPPLFGKGSSADTFETGSRSAVCGGTTTIIVFAPQQKSEDTLLAALEATHAKANGKCY